MTAEAERRWRERHPERYKAKNRRNTARREAAGRALIELYPREYGLLMADSLGNGKGWDARRRDALTIMRQAHPDDWKRLLKEARDG